MFEDVDVVVAGAQTAVFCAYEGKPVIATHVDSDLTAGVLFVDTNDAWYDNSPNKMSYAEAFEKVLIDRAYENRKPNLPERKPAEYHYAKSFEIQMSQAEPNLEYFTAKFKSDLRRNWIAQFPFNFVNRGAKIVIYGYGQIGTDYRRQIEDGGYCQLVGIVADNHEDYDDSILPPEKLTELEYDGIVIAEHPNQARIDQISQNISKITGKNNFIYHFQSIVVD